MIKNDTSELKNHFKYWAFILAFCYGLTFGVQFLVRPLWFIKSDEHTGLAEFETVFTILILPIVLVIFVYSATKKFDKRIWFILSSPIIFSCIYISAKLGFLNWADSIGSRQNPDNDTLMIVKFEWQGGLMVSALALIICFVILYWKKKKTST